VDKFQEYLQFLNRAALVVLLVGVAAVWAFAYWLLA